MEWKEVGTLLLVLNYNDVVNFCQKMFYCELAVKIILQWSTGEANSLLLTLYLRKYHNKNKLQTLGKSCEPRLGSTFGTGARMQEGKYEHLILVIEFDSCCYVKSSDSLELTPLN